MDYYEELGLRRTATIQEVRQTYKVLARLVHPDRQMDDQMRSMAQRQMQRLNEILATLTDEPSRRAYDAALDTVSNSRVVLPPGSGSPGKVSWGLKPGPWEAKTESRLAHLPEWAQSVVRNWFWISLVLAAVCVGVWCRAQEKSPPDGLAHWAPAQDVASVMPEKAVRQSWEGAHGETDAGLNPPRKSAEGKEAPAAALPAEHEAMQAADLSSAPSPAVPGLQADEPESSKAAPAAAGRERPETVTARPNTRAEALSFAGNWLSAEDPAEKPLPGIYPARYVELLLVEERGQLSGRYRAQYRVPDRAIYPEVSFRVRGDAPAGASARLRWTAADGAKGEMEIVLDGPKLMKLSWWSTELGRHPTLASGAATLIRQQVR
jgi:hypothetical protein